MFLITSTIESDYPNAFAKAERGSVVEIKLTRGMVALIDAQDVEKVRAFKWFARRKDRIWYAVRNICTTGRYARNGRLRKSIVPMHRFILDAPKGTEVDHKNGNGLDNRRENLRYATKSQNQHNQIALNSNNTSGYRGVSKHLDYDAWVIQIQANGIKYRKCGFQTAEAAALACDEKARELHGEFARLNFPRAGEQGVR